MPSIRSLLAFLLLATPAWADAEGSHPLTNQPFPLAKELAIQPPAALLVWHAGDGTTKRRFGEAKLVELVGSRPTMTALSLQVREGKAAAVSPFGGGIVTAGWILPAQAARLQAEEMPFIVTIDLAGRIHRFSYMDHWPMLAVTDSRFGPMPRAQEASLWQRIRRRLGLD
jgi:hypothetical protein